ncbi:MAG: hypothetical protein ABWZ78_15725 [Burkholderiaceae bacterium]
MELPCRRDFEVDRSRLDADAAQRAQREKSGGRPTAINDDCASGADADAAQHACDAVATGQPAGARIGKHPIDGAERQRPWRAIAFMSGCRTDIPDDRVITASGAFEFFFIGGQWSRRRTLLLGQPLGRREADHAQVCSGCRKIVAGDCRPAAGRREAGTVFDQ